MTVRKAAYSPIDLTDLYLSYAETAAITPGSGTAGNFTVGPRFFLAKNATIKAIKWYATHAATFKISVWNTVGTRLTFESVVVGSAGPQKTILTSPQALTASSSVAYTISAWDTAGGGGRYTNQSGVSNLLPALNASFQWGPYVRWNGFYFVAGDAFPTTGAGSEIYAMDPVF